MSQIRRLVGIGLFAAVLVVVSFLLWVEITSSFDTTPIFFVSVLVGAVVGIVLATRVPDNIIGILVLVATLAITGLGAGEAIQDWGVANGHHTLAVVASLINDTSWAALFVSILILLPVWFPDGVAINSWSRWVARMAIILTGLAITGFWLAENVCVSWPEEVCLRYEPNPWGISGWDGTLLEPLLLVAFLLSIPAAVSAIMRWRRSSGVVRQQLKWFVFAASLLAFGAVLSLSAGISTTLVDIISVFLLSAVWLTIGFAVLKYRLYDLERIISRTATYALVVAVLGALYFGLVTLITTLLPSQDALAVAGSTLAVAAVFNPARKRIQEWVDRRFNRSAYHAELVLEELAVKLREPLTIDELAQLWTQTATDLLQPARSGVWLIQTQTASSTEDSPRP